jgi:O-antigen/teichoic acid export membrane protein
VAASNLRPELYNPQPLDRSQIRPLLSFGGWLTVSNIIGPFMIYFDRFLVGSTLGLSAVTFYVTPYEIISKFQIFPNAVMSVFFPAMAATHVGEQDRLVLLYKYSEKMVYWVMLPITLGAFLLAPEGLFIWLGEDFRINATSVTRWLAAGCMVNMMARPAFTALQASGHPDLVAKAHLTELGFYIVLLWWLTVRHGIVGTAAAWTLRVFADTLLLSIFTARQLPTLLPRVKTTLFLLLLTSFLFWVASLITTPYIKLCLLTIVISISWVGLWPFVRCAMSRNSSPIDKHA